MIILYTILAILAGVSVFIADDMTKQAGLKEVKVRVKNRRS